HKYDAVKERFPTVDVRHSAASNREGTATFTVARNYPAYSGFRPRDYPGEPDIETITVRTERIDDVVGGVPWRRLSSRSTSRVPKDWFCTARAKPSSPTDRSSSSGTGTARARTGR